MMATNSAAPIHSSFTIERTFPASPARVFSAFADPAAKAAWFGAPPGGTEYERSLDFRAGGSERLHASHPDGKVSLYVAHIHYIERDRRLVYSYFMEVNDKPMSVSLATMDLISEGKGTRLVYTEQAVYLDGNDGTASRKQGTEWLFGKMGDWAGGAR